MADQVVASLREMILLGEIAPGEQVRHEQLAEELGVSTMPVREALLRLSHEGLIETRRGRSYRVATTTREDIADIYWLQSNLAGELTARACRRVGAPELERLDQLQVEWRTAVADGDVNRLETINFEFHRLINMAAGAPKLVDMMRTTLRMIPRSFYSRHPEWTDLATPRHDAIVAALRAGDETAARREAEEHVREAGELMIQYFDERGYWRAPAQG
ncbi:DNA-binding GntR family transcriptional regulator [Tamaricihabitans halophyticus]|uniref:DNA-binding GntR family transcriptional regulator n=1 Tax=Tamaricihabitans halophyticus TaxID=1262583 RepID=A0A4R2Q3X1_9PSEU|nr:GntR family transcriptional regulator [Tamaricihabitans halophyticus]TCP43422.1 DNA-binding GntR family transcriptional regulator [Tamaricihabitans halophyticus]